MARDLDLWQRIVIELAFAAVVALPVVVIAVNYGAMGPSQPCRSATGCGSAWRSPPGC